jgi:nucleotide-binding universal stress UspA family protein
MYQEILPMHFLVPIDGSETVPRAVEFATRLAAGASIKRVLATELNARDIAHAIVNHTEEHKVDLVVMGVSGMGGFKAFLIRSISIEVLKKSVCPVTIVH